ncbi:hypothetical protein PIB30_106122, partial [Stylosanthes scabra]|nr:hypothetical protein [Stylosanthes scabra]
MHPFPQHVPPPQIDVIRDNPYALIHTSITFGLGQAKSKTRSYTHPHNCLSHPPPTRFPTSSTNINTHPCIPSLILSRLAWGRHGQSHSTTLSSLASHSFYKPVSRL